MRSSTELTVRFSDCDPMGHMNNAVYFTFMEQARVALFKKFFKFPRESMGPESFHFILAEISCRFLKPTFTENVLIAEAKVTEIKNSSFLIEYAITNKASGEVVATGKSAQVWYDYKIKKSVPIPEEYKKLLAS